MVKLYEKTRVGPKGQIVIPKAMRSAFGISPGAELILETEEDKIIIEKPIKNVVEQMAQMAKKGKPAEKIDSDKDYEEMLEERWKNLKFT